MKKYIIVADDGTCWNGDDFGDEAPQEFEFEALPENLFSHLGYLEKEVLAAPGICKTVVVEYYPKKEEKPVARALEV